MDYTADMVLRVAQRYNNEKRTYLLVNPLQGKHMPVAPHAALAMMAALGRRVAAAYPTARLVIGFAETATAIGGIVAQELDPSCTYVQTTREQSRGRRRIEFLEEHSHAPEQWIAAEAVEAALARTDTVVFVDDELSTGRTLCNIIRRMQEALPALREKKLVAASLLNRLTAADTARLRAHGAESIALVQLPAGDYAAQVERIAVRAPEDTVPSAETPAPHMLLAPAYPSPRGGAGIGDYAAHWQTLGRRLAAQLPWTAEERVLVLGTEECMLPGLLVGRALADAGCTAVFFHATTRSPIGIADAADYPIRIGRRLQSLYETERTTYIYNLAAYDHVLIVTDAPQGQELEAGLRSLCAALGESGCTDVVCMAAGGA